MWPVHDLTTEDGQRGLDALLGKLRATTAGVGEVAQKVASIVAEVRDEGDAAVARHMQRWSDPDFDPNGIRVSPERIRAAAEGLDPELRRALEHAIGRIDAYQRHILPDPPAPLREAGFEAGLRFAPVERVGLAVPGGRAAYPSTLLMLAVPALVAGVPRDGLRVIVPPPTRGADDPAGDVSELVLGACGLLGITDVFRIGGAQGIAALAFGTETVAPVDMIAGPGNVFTQQAKQQVAGAVGIDGFYGPSEILTLADASADPAWIASDLLAQAEHDPGRCMLLAWEAGVIEAVEREMRAQLPQRQRREAIEHALADGSAALRAESLEAAIRVADRIAAEHVNLAVADPDALFARLRHGGEFFLGAATPVATGDYVAGPSHCLPTGTTARYASGVSAYTFLKRSGWVAYRDALPPETADAAQRLAELEGLDGHAASIRNRRS